MYVELNKREIEFFVVVQGIFLNDILEVLAYIVLDHERNALNDEIDLIAIEQCVSDNILVVFVFAYAIVAAAYFAAAAVEQEKRVFVLIAHLWFCCDVVCVEGRRADLSLPVVQVIVAEFFVLR